MRSCQFVNCHRKINLHDTHTSLSITREEEHKRELLKVEVGVCLSLEARHRAEEVEEEHPRLETEEEAHLVEEVILKSEEEEQAC